ncbi:MAG: hypothetical protein KDK10_17745 [Maritimibacter sp.]|nr:hypothetical protein [Maritimibacter sp.]
MTRRQRRKFDRPTLRLGAMAALVVASACAAPILATEVAERKAAVGGGGGEPVQCGVATAEAGGATTFRPWVRTVAAGSGSYRFAVSGPGTEIDQAGDFETAPGRPERLGEVQLAGRPGRYEIAFTVRVAGEDYLCRADAAEL